MLFRHHQKGRSRVDHDDVDAVAIDIFTFDDNITGVDPDPQEDRFDLGGRRRRDR
jgi:hypothetical protein